jgi:hypothetical protein
MSARRASLALERRRSGKWDLQGESNHHAGSKSRQERLSEGISKRSEWGNGGIELLYHVKVHNHTRVQRSATIVLDAKDKKERYLVLVRKKSQSLDMGKSLFFMQVVLSNDGTSDVKMTNEVQSLKAIEVPEDTHAVAHTGIRDIETTFCFPTLDVSLYFESESERNEAIWIIVKLSELYGIGKVLTVGEKIDLDAVGFTFASSGSMDQFPFLKKLSQPGDGGVSRDHADEEE